MHEIMTFDEFEKEWLRRHRGSIPRKRRVSTTRGWFWIFFWFIVAVGAAVYSAAHTIPAAEMTILRDVPQRSNLAISVFTIVELLIFGSAAKRHDIDWLRYVMFAAVGVALVSNVGSSVLAVNQNGGTLLNQFAGVLLSILAPTSALAAGEVLHIEQDKRDATKKAADDEYDAAVREMNAKINAAHKRYEKENTPVKSANLTQNEQNSRRNKPAPRLKKAVEWLQQHDDQLDTPPRQLEGKIGVSYGTIFTAQQMLKSGQFSQNGHHAVSAREEGEG